MKERLFKEQKLRTKVWRLFEVLPMDADDMDYDFDWSIHTPRPKKRIKNAVELDKLVENALMYNVILYTSLKLGWAHYWCFEGKHPYHELQNSLCRKAERGLQSRMKKYEEFDKGIEKSEVRDLVNGGQLVPELDTVRVYWDCHSFVRLKDFIADTSSRECYSVRRSPTGEISHAKTYFRSEFKCSWWGTMVVSREQKKFGKCGMSGKADVLCFEFSVAKWWNYASAVNSGEEPTADLILVPCIQAMNCLGICRYTYKTFDDVVRNFCDNAEIRRMDLSLNFKVPFTYTATDYVQLISKCYVNRQKAKVHEDGSISFATEKSPYRVIVYDKEKEAERFYNDWKSCQHYVYFEDEEGRTYPNQNDGATLKEVQVDEFVEKKNFYEKNKHLFKNNLRFEVQFRTKFFQEHNLMSIGKDNIDNVIRLGKFVWAELLDQMDQQLGRTNFAYKKEQKEPVSNALQILGDRRDAKIYSRTKANNMIGFIWDCYSKGWEAVYSDIGRDLFSRYRKWCLEELDYDVKICAADNADYEIPQLREFLVSRQGQMVQGFRLFPAAPEKLAI